MAPQQNLSARQIAIVVLGKTSWPLIKPVLATVTAAVNAATAGTFTLVVKSRRDCCLRRAMLPQRPCHIAQYPCRARILRLDRECIRDQRIETLPIHVGQRSA